MRDGVNGGIISAPVLHRFLQLHWQFIESDDRFRAVLTNQAGLENVACEQGGHRSTATRRFGKGRRNADEAFQPDLAVVPNFCTEPKRADQRMRKAPDAAL